PLRRGTEDHRRAMAPAMRVAVRDLFAGEQYAAFAQDLDDRVVRFPDELATDEFSVRQVDAVAANWIEHAEAVFLADREVLHAMRGGGVHGAGAVFDGNVIAKDQRYFARVKRVLE